MFKIDYYNYHEVCFGYYRLWDVDDPKINLPYPSRVFSQNNIQSANFVAKPYDIFYSSYIFPAQDENLSMKCCSIHMAWLETESLLKEEALDKDAELDEMLKRFDRRSNKKKST